MNSPPLSSNPDGNRIRAVVEVLLQDRPRFLQVVDSLLHSQLIGEEDAFSLRGLGETLKNSPAREVLHTLIMLSERNTRLLALLIAYGVYRLADN